MKHSYLGVYFRSAENIAIVPLAAPDKLSVKFVAKHKQGGEDGFLEVPALGMNFSRECLVRGGSGVATRLTVTTRFVLSQSGTATLHAENVAPRP